MSENETRLPVLVIGIAATLFAAVIVMDSAAIITARERPYSCRLLDDE